MIFYGSKHKRSKTRYGENPGQQGGWVELTANPTSGCPSNVAGHPQLLVGWNSDFRRSTIPAPAATNDSGVSDVK